VRKQLATALLHITSKVFSGFRICGFRAVSSAAEPQLSSCREGYDREAGYGRWPVSRLPQNAQNLNRKMVTRWRGRRSRGPLKIGPTFGCCLTYNPGHVGSPSFECLLAFREELVSLVDSRNS
jgi:hypothetical protein